MIVVDASVIVEVVLRNADGVRIFSQLAEEGRRWHAPQLLDVEVANALRRLVAAGKLTDARAAESVAFLKAMSVKRFPHEPLLGRIWHHRRNLSAYDAAYVALAEGLGVPLVTRDRKRAKCPGLRTSVELL